MSWAKSHVILATLLHMLIGLVNTISLPIDQRRWLAAERRMRELVVVDGHPFPDSRLRLRSGFPSMLLDALIFQGYTTAARSRCCRGTDLSHPSPSRQIHMLLIGEMRTLDRRISYRIRFSFTCTSPSKTSSATLALSAGACYFCFDISDLPLVENQQPPNRSLSHSSRLAEGQHTRGYSSLRPPPKKPIESLTSTCPNCAQ